MKKEAICDTCGVNIFEKHGSQYDGKTENGDRCQDCWSGFSKVLNGDKK